MLVLETMGLFSLSKILYLFGREGLLWADLRKQTLCHGVFLSFVVYTRIPGVWYFLLNSGIIILLNII